MGFYIYWAGIAHESILNLIRKVFHKKFLLDELTFFFFLL
jgi:hypothetical protein